MFAPLLRAAAVLCLLLAALLLGADASEYPGLSRAGLRALVQGAVPLLGIGLLNLRAVGAGPPARRLALGADLLLLAWAAAHVGPGYPPFAWMRLAVAMLLVLAAGGLHWNDRAPVRG
jgi:hypothetical protein